MSPEDFYDRCAKHDWYHYMSDDGRTHSNGKAEERELSRLAGGSARLGRIYAAWEAHKFSGPDFGSARVPKPLRAFAVSTFPGEPPPHNPNQTTLF